MTQALHVFIYDFRLMDPVWVQLVETIETLANEDSELKTISIRSHYILAHRNISLHRYQHETAISFQGAKLVRTFISDFWF